MKYKIIQLLYILLFLMLIYPHDSNAQQYPKPSGYVNDFAGVMSGSTQRELESFLRGFTEKTGAEIAVAVVKDMGGLDENTYAVELMKNWGVGSKERNDGILILVAVKERRLRIEVGYGLEHIITDARAGQIRERYMTPYLNNNDYTTGVTQGVLAVTSVIAQEKGIALDGATAVPAAPRQGRGRSRSPMPIIYIIVIIIFLLLGGRRGGRGLLTGMLIGSMLGGGRGRYYGGGGFGGGFGGGGGGFSGFGGGFSGGGGASGGF